MISTAKYARIDNNISWVYSLFVTEGRWKMKAYCVGCHTKKEMKDPKIIILKNGRLAMMAICLTCGTTIWHIKPILKSQKEKVKGLTRTAPRKNMVKRTVSILRKKRSRKTGVHRNSYRGNYIDDQAPDELSNRTLQMERKINRIVSGSFETGKHR